VWHVWFSASHLQEPTSTVTDESSLQPAHKRRRESERERERERERETREKSKRERERSGGDRKE
jgi:hypothetical protein